MGARTNFPPRRSENGPSAGRNAKCRQNQDKTEKRTLATRFATLQAPAEAPAAASDRSSQFSATLPLLFSPFRHRGEKSGLGLDHEKLTYRHSGPDFRLTDVYGRVVKKILARVPSPS